MVLFRDEAAIREHEDKVELKLDLEGARANARAGKETREDHVDWDLCGIRHETVDQGPSEIIERNYQRREQRRHRQSEYFEFQSPPSRSPPCCRPSRRAPAESLLLKMNHHQRGVLSTQKLNI